MLTKTQCKVMALSAVPGLGPKRILALADRVKDPEACPDDIYAGLGIGSRMVEASREYLEEVSYVQTNRIEPVTYWDMGYPCSLKDIAVPPVLLYCKGNFTPADERAVAIVGSRRCSEYGMRMAEKLAHDLAKNGVTVVSGMARGIDTAAHRGALKAGGRTIAVMGSGFGHLYPSGSRELAERISASGVVVTEYNSGTRPLRGNFPRRNRIISGLSKGIVVVEAAAKSGALITVDYALEQGKEVFAVPGRADSYASRGVNSLIRDGAALVTCAEDIMEGLGILPVEDAGIPESVIDTGLSCEQKAVMRTIDEKVPVHFDEIWERTGFERRLLPKVLLVLEMKKIIRTLPGNNYVRA